MNSALYYSNYCENCKKLLQILSKNTVSNINYICIDNRIIEKYLCDCTGQLTCSVFSNNDSILANRYLIDLAMNKVGRMIINDVPTGVVVSKAMQHGGPFPASSDSRFTAVGSASIFRFVRDVTIQKKII